MRDSQAGQSSGQQPATWWYWVSARWCQSETAAWSNPSTVVTGKWINPFESRVTRGMAELLIVLPSYTITGKERASRGKRGYAVTYKSSTMIQYDRGREGKVHQKFSYTVTFQEILPIPALTNWRRKLRPTAFSWRQSFHATLFTMGIAWSGQSSGGAGALSRTLPAQGVANWSTTILT